MAQSQPKAPSVNGGDGIQSYSKNSSYQRQATNLLKGKIEEAMLDNFDIHKLCSVSNTIRIADMGCATGPNTFLAMQNLVDIMIQKYKSKPCQLINEYTKHHDIVPEFQIFFNDHVSNDFNTLFASFSSHNPPYFVAGVPGSFHGQVFPKSSIHLVYSSIALHWLSETPKEVADPSSKAWNPGRIHYTSAPAEVVEAYRAQFANDVGRFLKARATELVSGGMVVIIVPGIPDGMPHHQVPSGIMYELMSSSFMDMVKDGLINEDQVDCFNLPLYTPSPGEMTQLINQNGSFDIKINELMNPWPKVKGPINIIEWVKHVRAAMEGMLMPHFNPRIIDDLFSRLIKKLVDSAEELESSYRDKIQLFIVLKCK